MPVFRDRLCRHSAQPLDRPDWFWAIMVSADASPASKQLINRQATLLPAQADSTADVCLHKAIGFAMPHHLVADIKATDAKSTSPVNPWLSFSPVDTATVPMQTDLPTDR